MVGDGTLGLLAIERLPIATDLIVNSPGVVELNNFNQTVNSLSGDGAVDLGSAQLVVGINGGSGDFGGVISGAGADFQKEGAGTQTLRGQNTYSGSTVVNDGELILTGGGAINQTSTDLGFNNGSNGTATAAGAGTTWGLTGDLRIGINGAGRMNIQSGAVMTVGNSVAIGAGVGSGVLSLDGGTLDNSAGNGVQVLDGVLQGHGDLLGDVTNNDTTAPGNSTGILSISDNYIQQGNSSVLSVEIGGTDNSDPDNPQFDLLDVGLIASLDGLIEVGLAGYTPAASDSFAILTADSVVGTFDNVADGARLNLSFGGSGSFQVDYNPTSVVLSDFSGTGSGFTADFNGDNAVDGDDLGQWQGDFGLNANSDADGDSDGLDFLTWQQQLGSGVPLFSASSTVPEPSSGMLIVWATALLVTRRTRKPE